MPTQSGNNRAGPASEEFEKVKESLKAVWKTHGRLYGKENAAFQRRNENSWTPQPARLVFGGKQRRCIPSPAAGLAGKQNIWGEERKSSFCIKDLMRYRPLLAREAEKRHAWHGSVQQSRCNTQPCSSSVERSQGSTRGFSGEEEDCTQDLALVYSFVVPHCPQMFAGWKVPDVAAANTNSASH